MAFEFLMRNIRNNFQSKKHTIKFFKKKLLVLLTILVLFNILLELGHHHVFGKNIINTIHFKIVFYEC